MMRPLSLVMSAVVCCVAQAGFINPGTPSDIPASYDCTARQQAWEFGKATLPQRGDFKTLYDAMQLHACDVPSPSTEDKWTPPTYPTPTAGVVIYADPAADAGGDVSKDKPFSTLAAAVQAAGGGGQAATVVLRKGTYSTEQIKLTSGHSKLTIQNYEGEEAVVSGAVRVEVKEGAWSPYKVVAPHWVVHAGEDNVYGQAVSRGDTSDVKYLGDAQSVDECQALAANSTKGPFMSLTWHSQNIAGVFATQCFGRKSAKWSPTEVSTVTSVRFLHQNTWRLDVAGQNLGEITGLRVGPQRAVRAKYPNGHPELSGEWFATMNDGTATGEYEEGWVTDTTTWLPPADQDARWNSTTDLMVNNLDWPGVEWPMEQEGGCKWTGEGDWGEFYMGMGGFCSDLTPPFGYWCSQKPPRGQCYDPVQKTSIGCTQTHMAPSGLSFRDVLPQAANYSNATGAVVMAWRGGGRWYTNMCLVESVDKTQGTIHFNQDIGCNQGGEGVVRANQWWIENVKEECDTAGEFFYDEAEQALYYTFNGTDKPTGQEDLWATKTKVVFNITGTQADPVQDVTIRGLTVRDAMLTYLGTDVADQHGMPSAGDWALQRSGAILLEGTERVSIDNNLITRVDGNGIFVSNYNRNATISNNELSWIGDTAMAAWGSTGKCLNANCSKSTPYLVGPDGRGGNQPRGTRVIGNLVREIGIWQKQSSMWFQAVTAQTYLAQNVHFNGPRAGVNFNDGFGGGDVMEGNLLANCVRESGDHGPINTWDRAPYITDIGMHRVFNKANATGSLPGHELATGPSVLPRFREIRNNFVFAVYSSQEAIDNDDGSSYYLTHHNYFVYAIAGLKSDFGGQWNHHYNNVYAYVGRCYVYGNSPAFYNNLCQTKTDNYGSTCEALPTMTVRNNTIHSPAGNGTLCPGDTGSTWSGMLDDSALGAAGMAALAPFPKPLA